MPRLKPITQHDFLVTIADFQGYWSTFSGVEDESETDTFSDGIGKRLRTVLGAIQTQNVTLEKPYDPVNDAALIQQINALRLQDQDITVTVEPVRRTATGPERIGANVITLFGCQIVKFTGFEVDTAGSDTSLIELELSVDDWTYA